MLPCSPPAHSTCPPHKFSVPPRCHLVRPRWPRSCDSLGLGPRQPTGLGASRQCNPESHRDWGRIGRAWSLHAQEQACLEPNQAQTAGGAGGAAPRAVMHRQPVLSPVRAQSRSRRVGAQKKEFGSNRGRSGFRKRPGSDSCVGMEALDALRAGLVQISSRTAGACRDAAATCALRLQEPTRTASGAARGRQTRPRCPLRGVRVVGHAAC